MSETRQMNATTWRLPDAPLRASAVATKLTALVAVALLAASARAGLPVGPLYAFKAPAAFAVLMLVSIGFLQQHHPFSRFGAANQITTVRALLVTLIVGLVGEAPSPAIATGAVAASLVVTLLDGVDGWLARRHRTASAFGARFDMETDALLILALSILAWRFGKAGAWVILSGAMRYAFVAAGAQWSWLAAPLPPSRRRQTVCVLQVGALVAAIVPALPTSSSAAVAAIALVALSASFLIDTVWLWRRAA
jgi:phosphatidylglycerophosphate synthase